MTATAMLTKRSPKNLSAPTLRTMGQIIHAQLSLSALAQACAVCSPKTKVNECNRDFSPIETNCLPVGASDYFLLADYLSEIMGNVTL